ncbi:beta-hydroxyaspartate dehydratase-like [Amphibalanus amphitrite]|uniref:beta-hydroxyaspartate dehydratase-like n=1 Tax=Amphibalanus amphitrite TaxID=1232801 RepID=UPI001C92022E|nr:beta-hydroxyaspartate dehydratase-like [Amphibalanus amphitrite]
MTELSVHEVRAAQLRIQPHVHRTPVITCRHLDRLTGRQLFFKAENLQKTGSFKARGACNAVFAIKERRPDVPGIVTHSSGNHGQATAYAAALAGLPCTVVVPRDTAAVKVDAIRAYGAHVLLCEPTVDARREVCAAVAARTGFTVAESSDSWDTMAGQGTIALELLEQVPDLDAVLVAVSGGGMAAGIAAVISELRPECKVFAVEPQGKELGASLRAGRALWPPLPGGRLLDTLADGCRLPGCGRLAFPLLCRLVGPRVITIADRQIAAATRAFWQHTKLLIEPSAGMAVAAALSDQLPPQLRRVAVILCGGNVDLDCLGWLAAADGQPADRPDTRLVNDCQTAGLSEHGDQ